MATTECRTCAPRPTCWRSRRWRATTRSTCSRTTSSLRTSALGGWAAVLAVSLKPAYLGDGCGLLVDPATWFLFPFTPSTLPRWSFGLGIPNDPTLRGLNVVSQVGYLRSVGGVINIDLTNATLNIVGS